jgi:hypothetical protein
MLSGEIFYTLQEAKLDHRELKTALQHYSSALFARLPTSALEAFIPVRPRSAIQPSRRGRWHRVQP